MLVYSNNILIYVPLLYIFAKWPGISDVKLCQDLCHISLQERRRDGWAETQERANLKKKNSFLG